MNNWKINPVRFATEVVKALGIPAGQDGKHLKSITIEITKDEPLVTVVYVALDNQREPLCEVLKRYGLHEIGAGVAGADDGVVGDGS